jgi:hypothetical protein
MSTKDSFKDDANEIIQAKTGNHLIDNALNAGMNHARLQAAAVHKRQILKRVTVIRDMAHNNKAGGLEVLQAALEQIGHLAETILKDYKERKHNDAES